MGDRQAFDVASGEVQHRVPALMCAARVFVVAVSITEQAHLARAGPVHGVDDLGNRELSWGHREAKAAIPSRRAGDDTMVDQQAEGLAHVVPGSVETGRDRVGGQWPPLILASQEDGGAERVFGCSRKHRVLSCEIVIYAYVYDRLRGVFLRSGEVRYVMSGISPQRMEPHPKLVTYTGTELPSLRERSRRMG